MESYSYDRIIFLHAHRFGGVYVNRHENDEGIRGRWLELMGMHDTLRICGALKY